MLTYIVPLYVVYTLDCSYMFMLVVGMGLYLGFNAGWPTNPYDIDIFNMCKQTRSHPRYHRENYKDKEEFTLNSIHNYPKTIGPSNSGSSLRQLQYTYAELWLM
jgi:hypothetical protein